MKRIIICCDGTWNEPNAECPSNVVKIKQAIKQRDSQGIEQVVAYDPGIGTPAGAERLQNKPFSRTRIFFEKMTGGMFGWGIDKNIKDVYRKLLNSYEDGDEVYLFGFSRGAYTVRSLAGLIYCSGLIPKDLSPEEISQGITQEKKIEAAYKFYRKRTKSEAEKERKFQQAERMRENTRSKQIPITLIGCWDTVGALGLPNIINILKLDQWINRKYTFHDVKLNRKINNALHAIALDEHKEAFSINHMKLSEGADTKIKEVWFPGTHGCVGGGTKALAGLSNAALLWMMEETNNLGLELEFDPEHIDQLLTDHTTPFSSALGIYRFAGKVIREVDRKRIDGYSEELHLSVEKRYRDLPDYRPPQLKKIF
ncbi:MAG: DUF2235 domain-containing protein [Limnothrix sp. RL_2_0]|nr:DUF2235 domain-containing protein [Limnothrix sp. RL_2_0]